MCVCVHEDVCIHLCLCVSVCQNFHASVTCVCSVYVCASACRMCVFEYVHVIKSTKYADGETYKLSIPDV